MLSPDVHYLMRLLKSPYQEDVSAGQVPTQHPFSPCYYKPPRPSIFIQNLMTFRHFIINRLSGRQQGLYDPSWWPLHFHLQCDRALGQMGSVAALWSLV